VDIGNYLYNAVQVSIILPVFHEENLSIFFVITKKRGFLNYAFSTFYRETVVKTR